MRTHKQKLSNGVKKKDITNFIKGGLTILISVLIIFTIVKAGSLTPSAEPGSTMHSLNAIYDKINSIPTNPTLQTVWTSIKAGYLDQSLSSTESNIRGADSDTLETLSDQVDGVSGGLDSDIWTNTKAGYLDAAISTRSSHSAANVWAEGARTLTDPGSYKADVSGIEGTGFSSSTHSLVQLYLNVSSTDPGVANVYYGTNYSIKGEAKTGTLERAGYSTGTIDSTYANGETDRFVVDQSGASEAGITSADDITTDKYAWSDGTWYGPGTLSAGGLTKTGQTTSYASSQDCGDGGTGGCDDGYYEKGNALSYTDNGNGTITDDNTGLMWKKCSEPDTSTTTCGGTHSKYNWQEAITQCEGLTYPAGSYSDWRLPNAKELWSIIKLEGSAPYIDDAFPGTVSDYYWSATAYAPNAINALQVYFLYGTLVNANMDQSDQYVRCVRE